ncbi:hypothetical protein BJY00DRAFT_302823 [Aspergillus carlsbadensis]|nr:hypothetical protein BJY00DRAFT_302823 [Aspergillus carlsbadensis]
MARRPRNTAYQSSSDSNSDRDSTKENKEDQLWDSGNAALLFVDNKHPPEYYIKQLENFDETIYTQEDYGKGTTALLDRLAKKHKLSLKGRDKPPLDVKDLAKHIQVSLLRDPHGGPHQIVIEFTFKFTKEWLGAKKANTYILPEIIYDPSLVLSPHVFLLGLLFADRAFNQVDGISISPNKPLPYSTLLPWVKMIGAITGFWQVTRPYSLRYGAGMALDSSGSISDSLRNLIMHHADTRTFLRYYLSRRINKNLPAIIRGLDLEDNLMRAAC